MSEFVSTLGRNERRHCILVVDDEPLIRLTLADYLTDEGFEVRVAASADEAIAILAATDCAINLVFSDVRMPGVRDGLGLSKWVFENRPHIPVIIVSGYEGKAAAMEDLCGAHTISKPFHCDQVAAKITTMVNDYLARTRKP